MKYFPSHLVESIKKDYPKIYDALELQWGEREFNLYIHKLFLHDRPMRQGFPLSIISELFDLQKEHDKYFPYYVEDDKWDNSFLE
jgi:hypothetical protein